MKLVMFTQTLDRNASVQGFAHEWVRVLGERLDRLFVIANEVGCYDLPESIEVYDLGARDGVGRSRKIYRLNKYLHGITGDHRLDGAFVHQIEHYGLAGWLQLWWQNVPIVQFKAHKGVPVTLWMASYLFDHFVTSSEGGLELRTDRKRVIGQGIDTNRFRPRERNGEDGPFTLTTVGRISPVKDYETLLDASHRYLDRSSGEDFRVRIVGGPGTSEQKTYLRELKETTRDLGIDRVVEFVPPVSNEEIVEEYRSCDLFVNLSRTGSLDKAVLEAMACECPIVTSNWAYREVLPEPLRESCMIEPGDVEGLVEKIDFFRRKRGTKDETDLTRQLREIVVEEHNLERFMDRLVEVFRALQGSR